MRRSSGPRLVAAGPISQTACWHRTLCSSGFSSHLSVGSEKELLLSLSPLYLIYQQKTVVRCLDVATYTMAQQSNISQVDLNSQGNQDRQVIKQQVPAGAHTTLAFKVEQSKEGS